MIERAPTRLRVYPTMRSLRSIPATAAYCLILGLCVIIAGMQLTHIASRLITWHRWQEPVPRFGQADIVYFSEPTCPACQRASPTIEILRRQYPNYQMVRVNSATPAGIALQEEYNRAYRVPRRDQDRIPIAFAGGRYFMGVDAVTKELPAYLRAGPLMRLARQLRPREGGRTILARRFQSLGPAPVLVAGLVDSINPCAVASLIFFLSYLTLGGRKPRDLLWIGGLFTLGAFTTYFLIGLGLLQALHSLRAVPLLARALYPLAALVTLALAALSFRDYRRARRGETAEIALQLPRGVKLQIHQVIRAQLSLQHLALAAFTTAVIVSALQFVCTSQIYLPTLMYMAQVGHERLRAIGLLLLYNLMFVLPLIVLFVAAYFGVSARSMAKLAARHTATTKLVMSFVFVGFTLYLCTVTARMFASG
jgi:cytochrome c biogenesis protein CcdA